MIVLKRGAAIAPLALLLHAVDARAADSPRVVMSEGQREDEQELTFGPAAGVEVGLGVVSPSVGTPFGQLLMRLGVAIRLNPTVTLVAGAETGLGVAVGSGSPTYGYVFRLPFKGFAEGIVSRLVDYRTHGYVNLHFGAEVGGEFFLSAECSTGTCNYIPAGMQTGFGARVGLSYSQGSRSAIGLFVRWDADAANGSCNGAAQCTDVLQTFTWNVAWTLF